MRARFTLFGGAAFVAIIGMMLIHFTVMPLDVLWFALMRKAGL